jgi:hypothetical protein
LKHHIQSIGGDMASYVKFGFILTLFAWSFNSRFNFAAEKQLLVNHKQNTSESIEISYIVYFGWGRIVYQIWAYSDIVGLRF